MLLKCQVDDWRVKSSYLVTGPPTVDIVVIVILASRKQYLVNDPSIFYIVVIAVLASRKPFVYESSGSNTMSMRTLSCLSIEGVIVVWSFSVPPLLMHTILMCPVL